MIRSILYRLTKVSCKWRLTFRRCLNLASKILMEIFPLWMRRIGGSVTTCHHITCADQVSKNESRWLLKRANTRLKAERMSVRLVTTSSLDCADTSFPGNCAFSSSMWFCLFACIHISLHNRWYWQNLTLFLSKYLEEYAYSRFFCLFEGWYQVFFLELWEIVEFDSLGLQDENVWSDLFTGR